MRCSRTLPRLTVIWVCCAAVCYSEWQTRTIHNDLMVVRPSVLLDVHSGIWSMLAPWASKFTMSDVSEDHLAYWQSLLQVGNAHTNIAAGPSAPLLYAAKGGATDSYLTFNKEATPFTFEIHGAASEADGGCQHVPTLHNVAGPVLCACMFMFVHLGAAGSADFAAVTVKGCSKPPGNAPSQQACPMTHCGPHLGLQPTDGPAFPLLQVGMFHALHWQSSMQPAPPLVAALSGATRGQPMAASKCLTRRQLQPSTP